MSRRRNVACLAFIILLVAAFGSALAGGITFMPVGPLGAFFSDISDDGTKVVGSIWYGPNFYWTRDGGAVLLGGGRPVSRTVISGDGRTIVGCATDENGLWNAARWLGGESWETLGTVPGGLPCDFNVSSGWGITTDGSKAVGSVWLPTRCSATAGEFDLVTKDVTSLGTFFDRSATRANGVSGNGRVVVGWQDEEDSSRRGAKRVDGVEEWILGNQADLVGEAEATNSDGSVIVGSGLGPGWGWRWKAGSGMKTVGPICGLPGGYRACRSYATDASENGSIVVGATYFEGPRDAWIWAEPNTFRYLDVYLRSDKVPGIDGWSFETIAAITRDGKALIRNGVDPEGRLQGSVVYFDAPFH